MVTAVAAGSGAAADLEAGKRKALVCAACHGSDGNATIPGTPSLAGQPVFFTHWQLIKYKDGRRKDPQMTPFVQSLSDADMADLSAYYQTQTPRRRPAATDPAKVVEGQRLADVHHCTSCHRPGLTGQEQAARLAGQETYSVTELETFQTARCTGPAPQSDSENFRTFVTALNIGGRTGKLKLAEGMGLLTEEQIAFIRGVAQVRNRYAHNVKNMHRSLVDILIEEQLKNGRIVEHVTGIKLPLGAPGTIRSERNIVLKFFMYRRLVDYLADALHTLRPPPLPEGGILSGLFGGSGGGWQGGGRELWRSHCRGRPGSPRNRASDFVGWR
jgi:cytochrome c553